MIGPRDIFYWLVISMLLAATFEYRASAYKALNTGIQMNHKFNQSLELNRKFMEALGW